MPQRVHKVEAIERFPTKPRRDGRFQKRIRNRLHYFGANGDRPAALREYDAVKHDLYAGRVPRAMIAATADSRTVRDLCNLYLDDILAGVVGTITEEHVKQVRRTLRRFVRFCGVGRVWTDLRPDDFTAFGKTLRKKMEGRAFNRCRAHVLAMFNHSAEQDWISECPKFGKGFARVSQGDLRASQKDRLLARDEINAVLGVSSEKLFAMILLGLNGGFGARDCAVLHREHVDLDAGVIRLRRPKTNIPRTTTLWPETIFALRRVMLARPDDPLIFRTKAGNRWRGHAVAHEFAKATKRAEVPRAAGVGLYACRHTFATYANEVRDTDARRHLMGRRLPGLDDLYVETLFLARLKSVTDHVRSRLKIAEVIGDVPVHPLS